MWELIRANKRKSLILFIGMGICLLLLGYFIGTIFLPPDGWIAGLVFALGIWFILSLVSYFSGDSILLAVSRARAVTPDVHPQLFHVVEEMKIAANLPAIPRVYIVDETVPNAFATGIRPEKSAIAVTAGLLSRLNRDELQGVVAHEMSHILNRDVLFVTFAGMMLGSIVLLSRVFLRGLWFSGGSSKRYRSTKKGAGQLGLPFLAIAIAFAILAPILTRFLYFAISRKREYLADATAVRLTRYPEGLASALEKISSADFALATANQVTAPMYIVNPLREKTASLSALTSTHPPISERIHILRNMAYGASYRDYQRAFAKARGKAQAIIPASGLLQSEPISIRKPSVEEPEAEPGAKKGVRDLGDLLRAVNKYAFLICACGLKIKVPPDFKKPKISCPRCGREHEVPLAELAALTAAAGATTAPEEVRKKPQVPEGEPQVHVRKGSGWESFACSCGRLLQISPAFAGSHMVCGTCGRKTLIKHSEQQDDAPKATVAH